MTDPVLKLIKDNTARKKAAAERLGFYLDQQAENLLSLIKERWSDPSDFRIFFVNVVRKITDRRSMVYKLAPVRTFEGWDQDRGEELYSNLNANVFLKKANRLTKLLKTSAIQVSWNEGPQLSFIPASILDAEHQGFPAMPTRLVVTHQAPLDRDTEYSDWTAATFRRLNGQGGIIREDSNPYGVLPFVPLFDRDPDGDFFLKGGDDLIEAQRAINVALSNLWRGLEWQCHGQPYATGLPEGSPVEFGPTRLVALPDGGSLGFAQPGGNIEPVLKSIEFLIKQTAVANDLSSAVFEIDPKAESAAAKNAENRDLLEARQDDIELWRGYEKRLFEVLKAVVNRHAPGTIPEGAELSIDFGEVQENLSDSERLNNYQRRIDLGIWSPVDALMADNPDVRSREEAIEILQNRQAETAIFGGALPQLNFEGNNE